MSTLVKSEGFKDSKWHQEGFGSGGGALKGETIETALSTIKNQSNQPFEAEWSLPFRLLLQVFEASRSSEAFFEDQFNQLEAIALDIHNGRRLQKTFNKTAEEIEKRIKEDFPGSDSLLNFTFTPDRIFNASTSDGADSFFTKGYEAFKADLLVKARFFDLNMIGVYRCVSRVFNQVYRTKSKNQTLDLLNLATIKERNSSGVFKVFEALADSLIAFGVNTEYRSFPPFMGSVTCGFSLNRDGKIVAVSTKAFTGGTLRHIEKQAKQNPRGKRASREIRQLKNEERFFNFGNYYGKKTFVCQNDRFNNFLEDALSRSRVQTLDYLMGFAHQEPQEEPAFPFTMTLNFVYTNQGLDYAQFSAPKHKVKESERRISTTAKIQLDYLKDWAIHQGGQRVATKIKKRPH